MLGSGYRWTNGFKTGGFWLLKKWGEGLRFLTLVAVGVFVLSLGSKGYAQSADPYDPNSPNYVGNKAKIKRPKWSAAVSSTVFQTQDEAAETGLYYDAVVGYYFNKKLRGDVTMGYSHTADFDAENPDQWEFEDISLRLLMPNIWKSKSGGWSSTLITRLDLPTSNTSLNAGQLSRLRATLQTTTRWKKFTFAIIPTLGLAWHEFETQDRDGFVPNSPLSLSMAATARYAVTRKIGLVAAAGYTSLFDYDFETRNIQVLSGSLQYLVNKKVFTALNFRWRDRVLTNNSLFDDDANLLSFSVGYTL
jgi:hypothetical protein